MKLSTVENALLLAAFFRGAQDGSVLISCSDQVVTLSLFYTGELSAEECRERFANRGYVKHLYTEQGELSPLIASRYRGLIELVNERPRLMEGGGDLRLPADPTFTAVRLTAEGRRLIPEIITSFPAKPEFPNWPDRRTFSKEILP